MSKNGQRKDLLSSGISKSKKGREESSTRGGSNTGSGFRSENVFSLPEEHRLAALEDQLQQLQKQVANKASSDGKLRDLLDQQERERERWEESRKSLERQLEHEREQRSESVGGSRESLLNQRGPAEMTSRNGAEWTGSRLSLERRLAEEKELREKLRRSPLDGNRRRSGGMGEGFVAGSALYRTSSSQSLPGNSFSDHTQSLLDHAHVSPASSLHNYPTTTSRYRSENCKSTLSYGTGGSLLNSSALNHSSSSLGSSHKSTQSSRDHAHQPSSYLPSSRYRISSSYSTEQHLNSHFHPGSHDLVHGRLDQDTSSGDPVSKLGGLNGIVTSSLKPHLYVSRSRQHSASSSRASSLQGSPPPLREGVVSDRTSSTSEVELERARLKIKTLEREVTVLEKLLGDKTRSSQRHVEELMSLRTQLAQEKASLAIVKQEARDEVERKLGVAKTTQARQAGEFELHLCKMEEGKRRSEKQVDGLKHQLLGKERECGRLQSELLSVKRELKEERTCRSKTVADLQAELQDNSTQMAKLENSLRAKKVELEGVVSKRGREAAHHSADMKQAKKQIESLSAQLKDKMEELVTTSETMAALHRDVEAIRVDLQRSQASWKFSEKALTDRLRECEAARDSVIQQLSQAKQKLNHRLARSQEEDEQTSVELRKYRSEVQRLRGVVKSEQVSRSVVEEEADRLREELRKVEGEVREVRVRLDEGSRKWSLDQDRVEECEKEGQSLREEVGRLSEELRTSQRRLQEEREKRVEKEKEGEESLIRLQQELAKRAQQVLEMDHLLQTHQTDTTARRLQLERNLSRTEGEVKDRTRELELLTSQTAEDHSTIHELRDQLDQFRENQKNLFSGSQAQLINKDSKLLELEAQLKSVKTALGEREEEARHLGSELKKVEGVRRELEVRSRDLEGQVEVLTQDNKTLRSSHQKEIDRLVELHACQLSSREEQVNTHRDQLQQLTSQDKVRLEELSRYRAQLTSLSAELSVERKLADDSQKLVLQSKLEAEQWQAQVSQLKNSLSALHEDKEKPLMAPAATTSDWTKPSSSWHSTSSGTDHSQTTPIISAFPVNGFKPSNYPDGAGQSSATPTNDETTPIPKGSIFNV